MPPTREEDVIKSLTPPTPLFTIKFYQLNKITKPATFLHIFDNKYMEDPTAIYISSPRTS